MANWFDTVTKTLADDKLSRRKAMRKAAGAAAGIALAALIPGEAFAASPDTCSPAGNCTIGFTNCGSNVNQNCFCFSKRKTGGLGRCGCNEFCSQAQSCQHSTDCPTGFFCSFFNGCTGCSGPGPGVSGICIHHCTKTCALASGHAGATAAH